MKVRHYPAIGCTIAIILLFIIPLVWGILLTLSTFRKVFTDIEMAFANLMGEVFAVCAILIPFLLIAAAIGFLIYAFILLRDRRNYRLLKPDVQGNYQKPYHHKLGLLTEVASGNGPVPQTYHNAARIIEPPKTQITEIKQESPQVALPLALPEKVLMIDIMRGWSLSRDNLFLALGKGSKKIACTLEGLMHVAHDAPTGQGKTVQFYAEIIMLLKLGVSTILANPNFAAIGKKGEDWRPLGKAIEEQGKLELAPGIRVAGLLRQYATIVKMLKWLSTQEIDRRFSLLAQGIYEYKPLYLFIDEWPSIVKRYPDAAGYLVDVLQRGRAVEVCVDVNAQGFLQQDVDLEGSARENFNTAFHMGGSVHSGAKLLDLPVKDMNALLKNEQVPLGRGIALLRNNESVPQAEIVRLPYVDNNYVYYMLGYAENWVLPEFRSRMPSSVSPSRFPSVIEQAQPGSMGSEDFQYTDVAQEADGQKNETENDLQTIQSLRAIGKRIKRGEGPADIVKSFGLPYGRATQELRATVDMIEQMVKRGEL